jgi:2,3-bisphosphoglycerate-dependent phosphoglycerate mutase
MSKRPHQATVVWAVRHGETDWNVAKRIQGHADRAELTPLGRQQAWLAAHELRSEPVDGVYSSDLLRARQTAAVIADLLGCEVRTDRRLRERSFGELEGLDSSRLTSQYTGIEGEMVVDPEARAPGGESLQEVWDRCADFLACLAEWPGCTAVVVGHGGSIRMMELFAQGANAAGSAWNSVANASIHRLDLPPSSLVRSLAPATAPS